MEACAKLLIHRVYQVANYIVLFTKDVVLFPSNYKNAYSPEGAITPFCTFFNSQDILSPTIVSTCLNFLLAKIYSFLHHLVSINFGTACMDTLYLDFI